MKDENRTCAAERKGKKFFMGESCGLMLSDYSISALIKDRSGNFYPGQSQTNKGGIFGLKYFANSFYYLGW